MTRLIKRWSKKTGMPPGSLVLIGKERPEKVRISIMDYDEDHLHEEETRSVDRCLTFRDRPSVTWINVDGIHDLDLIARIGDHFGFHPLLLEDVVNTGQRPKLDDYGDYLFIVLKMMYLTPEEDDIQIEQVSIILGPSYVILFQEREGDVFEMVRQRIRKTKGPIRSMKADYLAYALIDAVVDTYFEILERIGDQIEAMEEVLVDNPVPQTLQQIHNIKRNLVFMRKSVWPLRETVSSLERGRSSLITPSTLVYLRDVYDHTIQVIDTIETFRDMTSGMLDIYLSSLSNRMNEVMKLLTIIATIFIPLTFIAGVYGMNFQFMPELAWTWGYPLVWASMIVIAIVMAFYFRRKGWL